MSMRALAGTRPSPRPISGAVRVRRALALAGCSVLGVGLGACESTEQESARIGRENAAAARTAAPSAKAPAGASSHRRSRGAAQGASGKGSTSP
jgi:hypothetical protein